MYLSQRGFAPVLAVIGLVVLLVAIGFGVYLSQQQTVTNSQAGGASTPTSFYLGSPDQTPASAPEVPENLPMYVDVYARTTTDAVNLVQTKLNFPSELLEVESILDDPPSTNVKNWVERSYDNTDGTVTIIGAVPNPGFVSEVNGDDFMARIKFKIKLGSLAKTGRIEFLEADTKMYRNVGNTVIEDVIKTPMDFKIVGASATPSDPVGESPDPTPLSPGDALPGRGGSGEGDFNSDGKSDLVDLSILLSKYNTAITTAEDLNRDGTVNAFDFGLMLNILRGLNVIK